MHTRIIRSHKRRKTIQAREIDGVLEVRAPAGMSESELQPVIARFLSKLERRKAAQNLDDAFLAERASILNQRYFGNRLTWHEIRWSTRQNRRHGSCTPASGTIRISHLLANVPRFVLDYVILHELAHLLEPDHGPRFQALVKRYPRTERARGYLMAIGREAGQREAGQ